MPEDLKALARRNALALSDAGWRYDVERLIEVIERVVSPAPSVVAPSAAHVTPARRDRWAMVTVGVLAVVAAIVILSGILDGDGDDDRTGSTSATGSAAVVPTHPDRAWAAQANRICAEANDDIAALPDPESLDATEIARAGRKLVGIGRRQLRELQRLTPPADAAPKVRRLLRNYAEQNEAAEEFFGAMRLAAVGNAGVDVSGLQAQQARLARLGTASDELAKELDATTCAEGTAFSGASLAGG